MHTESIYASDYVIVADDETGGGDVSFGARTESTGTNTGDKSLQTGQPWWIMVVGGLVIIIEIGVILRGKEEEERGND